MTAALWEEPSCPCFLKRGAHPGKQGSCQHPSRRCVPSRATTKLGDRYSQGSQGLNPHPHPTPIPAQGRLGGAGMGPVLVMGRALQGACTSGRRKPQALGHTQSRTLPCLWAQSCDS